MRDDFFDFLITHHKDCFLTAIDGGNNLSCGWVFSRFQLRVNQFSVQGDFKTATTTGNKCESFNVCFIFAQ